ncbi:hemerythrin domain-containing protein [Polycladomyces sp. WAk]|uniref:Hemerythrin domain-containing protein n=2 Tax=Polycladomyces zharkentensis TaxID=2807616 RepID=A0ABS2WH58_9BACL|nr:hemerythrin domain-containing protein [Polycladomyces sp. WAk]
MPFHCGQRVGEDIPLCPALTRLKQEHIPLREQMEQLYQSAEGVGDDTHIADWQGALHELREKAVRFERELHAHSEREEKYLFPMMASYIGRESGPLMVMEYEHQKGKEYLQTFIAKIDQATAPVDTEKAKKIGLFMIQAYNILSQHFMKEENVLFPMAEQLLSSEEKDLLAKKMQTV